MAWLSDSFCHDTCNVPLLLTCLKAHRHILSDELQWTLYPSALSCQPCIFKNVIKFIHEGENVMCHNDLYFLWNSTLMYIATAWNSFMSNNDQYHPYLETNLNVISENLIIGQYAGMAKAISLLCCYDHSVNSSLICYISNKISIEIPNTISSQVASTVASLLVSVFTLTHTDR